MSGGKQPTYGTLRDFAQLHNLSLNTTSLFVLWPGMPKVPKVTFAIPCNFAKRRRRIDILPEKKNIKVLYKLIPLLFLIITRHAQSTRNYKIAIYLQYLKNLLKEEVNFLHVYKHQTLL